jgi:hypothetical protein
VRVVQLVIATFAGYVGVYGLIKIAMGNPKPVKPVKGKKHEDTDARVTAAGDGHNGGHAAVGHSCGIGGRAESSNGGRDRRTIALFWPTRVCPGQYTQRTGTDALAIAPRCSTVVPML